MRTALVLAALLAFLPARAAPRVDAGAARLLTDAVAVALQKDKSLDVLTNDDVRRAVDLEAQRQTLGCDESTCLAEVAGALGAGLVVYGNVGAFGDELALTLNLFNSSAASASGRVLVRAASVGALADKVPAAVGELLAARATDGPRTRVLVLDLAVTDASADAPAAGPDGNGGGPGVLAVVGGVTAGVGVLAIVGGAVAAVIADQENTKAVDVTTPQADALAAYGTRDIAGWTALGLFAAGAVLTAGGAAALVVDLGGE